MTGDWREAIRGLRSRLADRDARLAELEAENEKLRAQLAAPPPRPPGPLGWVYHYQCSKCSKERVIDISPARVRQNHADVLEEDRHRAWLESLRTPQAERLRANAAAEMREAAEDRAWKRERELRAERAQAEAETIIKLADGPWGVAPQNNDSAGQAAPSSTGWGEE